MKILNTLTFLLFGSLLVTSTFGQQKMGGKVVDVIDGKTLVVEMPAGRITTILHYIEIPEPGQSPALSQTVKDHLSNLVIGKNVLVEPRGLLPTKMLAQVYLNGADIGQQMVRDGAAWHTPAVKTGQNQNDSDSYETYQALARTEKRGVWSILDLKPAWEYRAEKEKQARAEEERQWQTASITGSRGGASYGPSRNSPRVTKGINNAGALLNNYDNERKSGSLRTPILGVMDPDPSRKTAAAVGYFYKEDEKGKRNGYYSVLMLSSASNARFRSSDMTVTIDEKQVAVSKGRRTEKKADNALEETLEYTVSRSVVEKMANGSKVILTINGYSLILLPGYQMLMFNLLDATK
ncbi:MAG: thermonuclease family protein [Acidobacteriota bacterium]